MKLLKKINKFTGLVSLIIIICILSLHIQSKNPDAYPKSKSVMLTSEHGECSGEQVQAPSGVSYILTASHCRGIMDKEGNFKVTTESGMVLMRKFLAEDPKSDLLLIEGLPGMTGLKIAKDLEIAEHIKTYTHGHGFRTYRTDGHIIDRKVIQVPVFSISSEAEASMCASMPKFKAYEDFFGAVCVMATDNYISDALIIPGSSGGMIVNDDNELVGVASAAGGGLSCLVTLQDIQSFLAGY